MRAVVRLVHVRHIWFPLKTCVKDILSRSTKMNCNSVFYNNILWMPLLLLLVLMFVFPSHFIVFVSEWASCGFKVVLGKISFIQSFSSISLKASVARPFLYCLLHGFCLVISKVSSWYSEQEHCAATALSSGSVSRDIHIECSKQIQMKLTLLWEELAIFGSAKTTLKFKYEI